MSDRPYIPSCEITTEATFLKRRFFKKLSIWAGSTPATFVLNGRYRLVSFDSHFQRFTEHNILQLTP